MAQQDWFTYPIGHGYSASETRDADTPHFADDVETPFHTPITTLFPGYVTEADVKPWGGVVEIKPDPTAGGKQLPNEYFYHLDTVDVHVGDHVTTRDRLGLSGGENTQQVRNNPGAYPGYVHPVECDSAACYSSGPHTHVGFHTGWYTGPYRTLGGATINTTIPKGPDITPYLTTSPANTPVDQTVNSVKNLFNFGDWFNNLLSGLGITGTNDLLYRALFIGGGLLFIIIGIVMITVSVGKQSVQQAAPIIASVA